MTSGLAIQVRKEVREALPWWLSLGGLAVISVSAGGWRVAGADRALFLLFGFLGFAAGSVALGANVFGHEYTHRTMTGLLALPVRRSRLLLLKLGVLMAMVALLTLLMFFASRGYTYSEHLWRQSGLVIAALAVGVAPCLTLVFRSALAGAAFAAATPLIFWLTGLWIPGWSPSDVEALMKQGSLFVSGAGLVVTGVLFQRLEALDGPVSEHGVPGWFRRTALDVDAPVAPPRTHHPIVALVAKELRLQRMTILISVLFAAAWLITVFERAVNPQPSHLGVLFPLTAIHGVLVAVMAGALAFAEERQLGAWSMQMLLPIRSARQADVKVVVALSLSMLLAIALPLALNAIAPASEALQFDNEQVIGVLLICASALYVSSASASGIRAVLTMLPFTVLVFITAALVDRVGGMSADIFQSWSSALPRIGWSWRTWRDALEGLSIALLVGQVALMLALAYRNHGTADRSHRRYAMQVGWLVLYALVAVTVFAFVGTMANVFARSVT